MFLFCSIASILIVPHLTLGRFCFLKIKWSKNSSLHFASSEGHIEVVRLLLDRGADIQARNMVSE
jgi:hypothetical protein